MTVSLDQHGFMTTFTGESHVSPTAPDPDDIRIRDIAHALSQLCRFTGHTREFYSVAQHSVLVSYYVPQGLELEGLMHDAHEAYINDLSRPLKHHPSMSAYVDIEHRVDTAIRTAFNLLSAMPPTVKLVDNLLVVDEALQLMADHSWADGHESLGVTITCWSPTVAESMFLNRYHKLTGVTL